MKTALKILLIIVASYALYFNVSMLVQARVDATFIQLQNKHIIEQNNIIIKKLSGRWV